MLHIRDSKKTPRKGSNRIIIKIERENDEKHAMPYHADNEVKLFTRKSQLVIFHQVLAFNRSWSIDGFE